MNQTSRTVSVALLASLILTSSIGMAQTVTEVSPAVVYLLGEAPDRAETPTGKGDLWIQYDGSDAPVPLRKTVSGTGFVLVKGPRLFLVSAQHVARELVHNAKVVLRGDHDVPLVYELKALVGPQLVWTEHKEADVAAVELRPPDAFQAAIKTVAYEQLSATLRAPDVDLYLTTIGIPLSLGISGKFSPIIRTSHAASGLLRRQRFDTKSDANFFILEDPSVSGFSGAPVVKLPTVRVGVMTSGQGQFECVGLVHGTLGDPTGGKFAAIVPAAHIRETIDMIR